MKRSVLSLLVAAGVPMLAATQCDTSGPVEAEPDVLWTIPRFVNTDRGMLTDTSVIVGALDAGALLSLDRRTGAVLWERTLEPSGAFFEQTLVEYQGLIFAAPFHLYAVEAGTGTVRWTFSGTDGHVSRYPALAGGALYVATQFGDVVRLAPTTGEVQWRVDLREAVFPATVAGGTVLVGTRSFADTVRRDGPFGAGRVVALSAADGSLLWEVAVPDSAGFPGSGGVVAEPIVVNGIVVVGTRSSRVLGLRLSDGAVMWEYAEGSPVTSHYGGSAAVGQLGNLAVLLRRVGALEAFDPVTGRLVWVAGTPVPGASEGARPSVVGDRVYAVIRGNMWIVGADGTVEWRYGKRADGDGLPVYNAGPTVASDGTIFAGAVVEGDTPLSIFSALRPPASVR